jgi:dienelactone hydrolase
MSWLALLGRALPRALALRCVSMLATAIAMGITFAVLPAGAAAAPLSQSVDLPSLQREGGTALVLPGHWFVSQRAGSGPAPALVLMHGCGGLFDRRGRLADRYVELAGRLNALGIHALATDSLRPRGEKELCTQRLGQRKVTMTERRADALGALQWLAQQPRVDAARVGLLGWSNGGSAVLAALNLNHPQVKAAPVRPSLAVAFYPGCDSELKRGFEPSAPLLMLVGEADDWTPAAPCKALAAAAASIAAGVQIETYAGAFHGFDGTAALRLRRDVPNGVNGVAGVQVGGDPAARAAAAARLEKFLRDVWQLKPKN